ncbi:MAG: NUDIX domain-containing protein [Clostridia bacterium]|nr:NUDIX domain-containing protein [Clostridia bacterium]MBR3681587.1 NUDIX domain-containing protein [Clostridia bacterium]
MSDKLNHEYSAGVVVFKRERGKLKYLVIKSLTGVFGFPKGHIEAGESEKEAAVREVLEETGITTRIIDGFERRNEYPIPFMKDTVKHVVYFLGEYVSGSPTPQKNETSGVYFYSKEIAAKKFYFDNLKKMLYDADAFVKKMGK